ncbi:MAG: HdeD family acid-resistance protein [Myxococcales bacterium]
MAIDPVSMGVPRTSATWGGAFVLGLLMMVVGVLALASTAWTGIASIIYFGVLIAASGIAEIVHALRVRRSGGPVQYLLGGILSVVVGVLMAARPGAGLVATTLLLIGYFFVSGLFRVVSSVIDRYAHWGYDFAYGLCALVLGVVLAANFPVTALWLVGTLVGLEIIFRGAALMAGGLALRQLRHHQRASA